VVEALNSPNGRETFKEIATIMDEIITEWKDYSIPLEKRLEVSASCACCLWCRMLFEIVVFVDIG
jgi:hypothetical protein